MKGRGPQAQLSEPLNLFPGEPKPQQGTRAGRRPDIVRWILLGIASFSLLSGVSADTSPRKPEPVELSVYDMSGQLCSCRRCGGPHPMLYAKDRHGAPHAVAVYQLVRWMKKSGARLIPCRASSSIECLHVEAPARTHSMLQKRFGLKINYFWGLNKSDHSYALRDPGVRDPDRY